MSIRYDSAAMRAAPFLAGLVLLFSCHSPPPEAPSSMSDNGVTPPVAERRQHEVASPHGTRLDEYYWMRDDTRQDPDVLAYLEAENAYKEAVLAPVRRLEENLFQEIVGRIKQDDETVPYRYRDFYYYTRFEEGREYPIYARRRGSLQAPEEIMLDVNSLAGDGFYQVAGREVSPNGTLLCYGEDTSGRRQYTLRFKDLASGELLGDPIPNTTGRSVWADDNRTLFYVEKDPVTLLGVRVKRHILGTDPSTDPVVYEEHDHSFYLSLGRSADHKYIAIGLESTVSSETLYLAANDPSGAFQVLVPRERDLEYDADHVGERWIFRTNHLAVNFRIVELSDGEVREKKGALHWREIVPHDEAVLIESFQLFDDYLVTGERSGGLERIQIRAWKGDTSLPLAFDEPAYSTWIDVNAETDTPWLRYAYTSMTTPLSTWEVNMQTGERRRLKQKEVPGFDPEGYATERLFALARDGSQIPITLVYKKGFARDGTAPLYQYGYGSYGSSTDPTFWSGHVSLLDRGFVLALAHIRGGQEMGRAWYDDGKLLNKKNSFRDFIDVTEFLVAKGYAAPDKVVAVGGSAGGLLMGAIVNMRSELYRAIVADVPFVDVVTTMLDESIPLTTNEFDEWGNPKQKAYYDYMLSYSPYDNVRAQHYPAMLVTTGLWDSQVQYFEPAKWVARLRARKTDQNSLLFHVNTEAGHGGESGRFRSQRELAQEFAFVLQELGLAQ